MGSPTSAVLQTSFSKDWIEPHIPRPSPLAIDTTGYFAVATARVVFRSSDGFSRPKSAKDNPPQPNSPPPLGFDQVVQ